MEDNKSDVATDYSAKYICKILFSDLLGADLQRARRHPQQHEEAIVRYIVLLFIHRSVKFCCPQENQMFLLEQLQKISVRPPNLGTISYTCCSNDFTTSYKLPEVLIPVSIVYQYIQSIRSEASA